MLERCHEVHSQALRGPHAISEARVLQIDIEFMYNEQI